MTVSAAGRTATLPRACRPAAAWMSAVWTSVRVAPAGVIHLLGTVKTFREQIPAVVSSLYPRG